ncbi:MAG: polyamine ABC transporter ATP-binding protein [Bacteroidales bacterium]|nr:polyamine ABC transporter ATP-binding protein [Bacteroidales bacterium]
MADKDIIIKLEHLSKRYEGKEVLHDINLYIRKGEFLTLLGPSGCGKSTTLRLIAGFLQPDEGRVLLSGKDMTGIPPYRRPLNTVFQRYALFPHLDVYDNVAFGLKLQGLPEDKIDAKVRKALKMVTLTDYEDRDVESLSGGQQQRVAIARAIVNQPKVLLLDEPLAALDRKMRADMQIELRDMHKKLGITFIYVTHDQEEALTLSDTIVVMDEGRIQQIGTPADIYNEPVNSFVANFIGESNIFNGTMVKDRLVSFIGHDFPCVDSGFGEQTPVDVVVRPEDVVVDKDPSAGQFSGKVTSCIFKGVHYEMLLDTDSGNEIMIQNYLAFEPGTTVGMSIPPDGIQVMKKERLRNTFEGEISSPETVDFLGATFNVGHTPFEPGTKVRVEVEFSGVNLLDDLEAGELEGEVHSILYKGDHYHLTVCTPDGDKIYVDTDDVWDKGDLVGIEIAPKDIKIKEADDD